MQLKFLKPNIKNILLAIGLFILFQSLDMKYGFGGGIGFPIKFWALGWLGLSAGFFFSCFGFSRAFVFPPEVDVSGGRNPHIDRHRVSVKCQSMSTGI